VFSNAGHNPPLLVRDNGECVRLEAGGSVLGAFPNAPFAQQEIQLHPGDRLLLFTDGLTEACDDNGECVRLEAGGSVLGAFPNAPFAQQEIQLHPGDRLLLFTDGLTEACDENGEQFGEQQLIDLLQTHRRESADDLKQLLLNSAAQFCDHNFRDDAALMVIAVD
jgi:serine phosphatase RsbU (regulator of sigma subunit)